MAIADVVDVVAMKIHVTATREILDEDAFGLADGAETRRRNRLMQEGCRVAIEQRAGCGVEVARPPIGSRRRSVGVAFGLRRSRLAHRLLPYRLRHAWNFCSTARSITTCSSFAAIDAATIRMHMPAADAVKPASSMLTDAMDASLVSVE